MSQSHDTLSGHTFVVPAPLAGLRAGVVLERLLSGVRRNAIRRLFREGAVRKNGSLLDPWKKLRDGDVLMLSSEVKIDELPRFDRAARRPKPRVLYQDAACVVVDKPAGVPTVPDRAGATGLHGWAAEEFPDDDLRIVHRLDKATSGVVVLARGADAARAFDVMFRERQVRKFYDALVRGAPVRDEFSCDTEIGRTITRGRVKIGRARGSREALTDFTVVERFQRYALLEARPRTGRMHQIRAHLASMHMPLAVDPLYGRQHELCLSELKPHYQHRRGATERPLIDRLTLHARKLVFVSPGAVSPGAEQAIEVEAPLPKDLRVTLEKLRRFAAVAPARESRQSTSDEERA